MSKPSGSPVELRQEMMMMSRPLASHLMSKEVAWAAEDVVELPDVPVLYCFVGAAGCLRL